MRAKSILAILLISFSALAGQGRADAQTTDTVVYAPGWNMVGGPAGTDLSVAEALEVYSGPDYQAVTSKQTAMCVGYWAYFATSETVHLNQAPAAAQESCAVQAGWTLVGNPFAAPAGLPAGTAGFLWNPQAHSYQTVTSIPVGGAVWIYTAGAGAVMLQASAGGATFTFGRQGGNIVPYQVTINSDGTVTASGPASSQPLAGQVSAQQLAALLGQARADSFFSMPPQTNCPGTLPDVASLFIQINAPSVSAQPYRVQVHGNCVPAFNQLFAALQAAVGAGA